MNQTLSLPILDTLHFLGVSWFVCTPQLLDWYFRALAQCIASNNVRAELCGEQPQLITDRL